MTSWDDLEDLVAPFNTTSGAHNKIVAPEN